MDFFEDFYKVKKIHDDLGLRLEIRMRAWIPHYLLF